MLVLCEDDTDGANVASGVEAKNSPPKDSGADDTFGADDDDLSWLRDFV